MKPRLRSSCGDVLLACSVILKWWSSDDVVGASIDDYVVTGVAVPRRFPAKNRQVKVVDKDMQARCTRFCLEQEGDRGLRDTHCQVSTAVRYSEPVYSDIWCCADRTVASADEIRVSLTLMPGLRLMASPMPGKRTEAVPDRVVAPLVGSQCLGL